MIAAIATCASRRGFSGSFTSANPTPYFGILFPSLDGPSIPIKVINCLNEAKDAGVWAYGAAKYISANANRFGPSIVYAARTAVNNWQGTGMGVAAAAEFVGLLVAGLSAGELLLVAGGIGVGIVVLYSLAKCVGLRIQ